MLRSASRTGATSPTAGLVAFQYAIACFRPLFPRGRAFNAQHPAPDLVRLKPGLVEPREVRLSISTSRESCERFVFSYQSLMDGTFHVILQQTKGNMVLSYYKPIFIEIFLV